MVKAQETHNAKFILAFYNFYNLCYDGMLSLFILHNLYVDYLLQKSSRFLFFGSIYVPCGMYQLYCTYHEMHLVYITAQKYGTTYIWQ